MYLGIDPFAYRDGRRMNVNNCPPMPTIKPAKIENKKIALLDKVDALIKDGYSYDDITKAIEIHKVYVN